MLIIKKIIIIVTLLQTIFPYHCFGNDDVPKSYFVKPIEVICDYPFNDTTKWAVTCRVWGLLKYYHPNVAAGNFDWDKVLIDRLDKIHDAITPEQVNYELMQMIQIARAYKYSKDTTWNDSLNMNVNLCWLDHSFINDTIRQVLREIASMTIIQPSYYIISGDIPAPKEKVYEEDVIIQYKYRLLALFRYWNVIYYFYPYKYLMDQSWDTTLSEFIPQFMTAYEVTLYHKAVQQLATRLNDGHASTSVRPVFSSLRFKYITKIDTSTVVRTPPEESSLERGDIILSLNGKNIRSVRDSISALIPSSNQRYTDNAVNCCIYQAIMDGCILTVMRNQQVITFREDKKSLSEETEVSPSFYSISPDICYVNMDILKSSDIPDMMDSLNNYKGVIFDLRNYPMHFYYWELFRHIHLMQEHCYALATCVDLFHCGAFYKDECHINYPDEIWQGRKKYNGKIVVLINVATVSMSETFAMDFRTSGATLVGTPTAGANGNVIHFPLPGKITAAYSALGFYYPNGDQIQRKGIIPDIEVYPTMDDIMAGRDEILEAAITYINSD